ADEVEVRRRGGGEADLDLLEAELHEQVEEAALAAAVHRVDERLVAVTQVGGAPDRRSGDDPARPGAVGQLDGLVRAVLLERHGHGGSSSGRTTPTTKARVCRRTLPLPGKGEKQRAGL